MPAARMENIGFSGIREIFEECSALERAGEDVIHLEIGRPDFDTPERIKAAGIDAIERGDVHYTSNYGILELREAIAKKLEAENGLVYLPEDELVVTTGAVEGVLITVLACVDPGEEVLVPDPSWSYEPSIHMAGARPVPYPLDPASGFQPDVDELEAAASEDTALLIVNSPNNPTGGVIDSDRARAIADIAETYDITLLSDEIYETLQYDGDHQSLAAVEGLFDRTVTVNGFSKAYAMTGWRIGYLAAPAELFDPIIRVRQYTTTCAPSIAQHAAVAAFESDAPRRMRETFKERRAAVCDRIAEIQGMELPEAPAGAMYALPTIPKGADDDLTFARSLLREQGVAVVPGRTFGAVGGGRVRIAYGQPQARLHEAFDRIERWQ